MTNAPDIFDNRARRIRRARAAKRTRSAFLIRRCAQDAAERLLDISRQFDQALIIAPPSFWDLLIEYLPDSKRPKNCTFCYDSLEITPPMIASRDGHLPFESGSFDLVISILNFHSVNDLPRALSAAANVLKPDGLMLAAYFGGNTLTQLRQSFYSVESERLGGLTPRVIPMIDFSQSAALLQRAGFALPVVDMDRFTLSYDSLSKLAADLRDAGETSILSERQKAPLSRDFYDALETDLKTSYPAKPGRFSMSFEILWATGWTPHESQQKPLKPGSAKMRLSEALGTTEQKL